jgi:hypothetical protein
VVIASGDVARVGLREIRWNRFGPPAGYIRQCAASITLPVNNITLPVMLLVEAKAAEIAEALKH